MRTDPEILKTVEAMSEEERMRLQQMFTPKIVEPYTVHIPHVIQQFALTFMGKELLFGGAAGGGKSDYLLMAALQFVDVPGYSALILRRTWPDLISPGAILDRAMTWWDGLPVRKKDEGRQWLFPSGARIQFGSLQFDRDKAKYQSSEYQFIGFDELTHWEEGTYTYMFSRLRRPQISCLNCDKPLRFFRKSASGSRQYLHVSAEAQKLCFSPFPDPKALSLYPPTADGSSIFDVPLRMRAATNPGGVGHQWVKQRFVDPETRKEETVFIPSLVTDNPHLDQAAYMDSLSHLLPIDRERLLNGDWDVTEEGQYFNRHDFQFIERAPKMVKIVRRWDQAATVKKRSDWTVGALCGIDESGLWYLLHVERFKGTPVEVERRILKVAEQDGRSIPIVMEQEPGSAGVNNISHYSRNVLAGFQFKGLRSTGDKETRAKSLASMTAQKNFYVVLGEWTRAFVDEASLFPNGQWDDQVDAVSLGFDYLVFGGGPRTRVLVSNQRRGR